LLQQLGAYRDRVRAFFGDEDQDDDA
jgi:hypothetical protein